MAEWYSEPVRRRKTKSFSRWWDKTHHNNMGSRFTLTLFLEQGTADPDRALTVARLMWVLPLNWTLFQRKLSQFSSTLITKNVGAFQNRRSIRQATTLKACLLFFCFQFSGFYDLGEPEPSWTRALRFPTIHFLNILTQNKQMENTKYLDICKLAIITVDLYSIHPKTCSNVVSVPVFEMF